MAISITGKLNKAANQFQAGESTGFGVRLGVRYYDRETQQNEYTNYEAVIFAKAPAQVQFYQQALVEGSVIELSGTTQKIKSFDGQNGQVLSIEIHDAKLGFVYTGNQPQQQQQAPQQNQGYQNAPQQQQRQQAPQQQQQRQQPMQNQPQYNEPPADWDEDIPF
ncbi:single strand DNA binding protein [Vibrio phage K24]|nr:single-stranded DNA-binding protein [Vibrio phage 14E30.1]QZI92500.1 single-stranded DNA-binding protein [Vibrio phage 14E30.2]